MTPTNHASPAEATSAPPDANWHAPPSPLDEPPFEECHAEYLRYYEDSRAGRLDLTGIPDGHYLAYYGGRIHDHDTDSIALQHRVAAALGVHWARVVIDYPWMTRLW